MSIDVIKELDEYNPRAQKILMYRRQLEYLEQTKISTAHFDDNHISGNKKDIMDSYDDMMCKKEELKVIIAREEFKNLKIDVAIDALEQVYPFYASLIKYRYLQNNTLETVADRLDCNYTTVTRNIPKAKNALKELLELAMQ